VEQRNFRLLRSFGGWEQIAAVAGKKIFVRKGGVLWRGHRFQWRVWKFSLPDKLQQAASTFGTSLHMGRNLLKNKELLRNSEDSPDPARGKSRTAGKSPTAGGGF
jgi:hypothetical protein